MSEPQPPTSPQLRDDINSGRTGDKTAGFDPAAAPLGTDEEAAGTPPSPGEIAQARRLEGGRGVNGAGANAAEPALTPDGVANRRPSALIWAVGLGVLAVIGAAALLAS